MGQHASVLLDGRVRARYCGCSPYNKLQQQQRAQARATQQAISTSNRASQASGTEWFSGYGDHERPGTTNLATSACTWQSETVQCSRIERYVSRKGVCRSAASPRAFSQPIFHRLRKGRQPSSATAPRAKSAVQETWTWLRFAFFYLTPCSLRPDERVD